MKIYILLIFLSSIFFPSCESESNRTISVQQADSTQPVIIMYGPKVDTAYLFSSYIEKGAAVQRMVNRTCADNTCATADGYVDTHLLGTYYIRYHGTDKEGTPAPAVTRTVHVVQNNAAFLNGSYNVTFNCVTAIKGVTGSTQSSGTYTASIGTGDANNVFQIIPLKIGDEYVIPSTALVGNLIEGGYFSPNYTNTTMSGTLSASKNTFTIESTAYSYYPSVVYRCKNVFNKQVVLAVKGAK